MKPIIKTSRTYLRYWEEADLKAINQIFGNAEVMNPVRNGGALTKTQTEELLNFFLGQYKQFGFGPMAVVLKDTQQIIGINGIKQIEELDYPDLGFAFLKEFWGKGYAQETSHGVLKYAFDELEFENILALVHPENLPSVHLLKKMGFSFDKSIIRKSFPTDIYKILK